MEQLALQIDQAFSSLQYPGDHCLCVGVTDDSLMEGWEPGEIAAAFKGYHWREVPIEVLASYQECFSFFTPEAFRFYLPAYLRAVLVIQSEGDGLDWRVADIPGTLLGRLLPACHGPVLWDFVHQRIDPLTHDQKSAVRGVIHQILGHQVRLGHDLRDHDKALFAFWGYPDDYRDPPSLDQDHPIPEVLAGAIRSADGVWSVEGETCVRIQQLIGNRLVHVDQRAGGSALLYHDPTDRSYWEVTYPWTDMHGGGPPLLRRLTNVQVARCYQLCCAARDRSADDRR